MHRKTASDLALERRIYEAAAKDEETYLMLELKDLLDEMPPPPHWYKKKGPGRPRKKRRGHPEEFTWKAMVLVLLLKTLHGLTYRETTSHLRANPELCARMGLPRAPSPKTIMRTQHRLSEAWLKRLNKLLVGEEKKRGRDGPGENSRVWIVLD